MERESRTDAAIDELMDYMYIGEQPQKSDVIIGIGSIDMRVGMYAVDLMTEGYGEWLVFTGGHGKVPINEKPEAELFGEIAQRAEIDSRRILIETEAANTFDNVRNTERLLIDEGIEPRSILAVTKPCSERRVQLTFDRLWSNKETQITVVSPKLKPQELFDDIVSRETWINLLVGDVHRLMVYPDYDHLTVPDDVQNAFDTLVDEGYTEYLVEEKDAA